MQLLRRKLENTIFLIHFSIDLFKENTTQGKQVNDINLKSGLSYSPHPSLRKESMDSLIAACNMQNNKSSG